MKEFEDRLAKYVAGNLFHDYVRVEVGAELLPDSFRTDVVLIPDEPLPDIFGAGLLTKLTQDARCLIEPFSGSVESVRLEGNLTKLRLLLQRAYNDDLGVKQPKGVLWLIATYWPHKAMREVFEEEGELIEPGLRKWKGFLRETVYLVNTAEIELRDDTILFRLFGKDKHRREVMVKIFRDHLEPYITLLNQFDMRFREMAESEQLTKIDPEELKNLVSLRDTREEVLRELGQEEGRVKGREEGRVKGREEGRVKGREEGRVKGREEGRVKGREEARHEIAKKLLEIGEPLERVASVTGLSLEDLAGLKI